MSTISKVPSASQSRLVKQVLNSNPDGVSKALRTASANDIADAIRASNEVVAREVKGGKTGFRPSQVDALLRNKMFELDSKHPVLNEVIADGARSAEELQDVRDAAIATKRTEAEARRPYNEPPKQLSASQATGSYGRSYSSIAGYDTDLVTSLTVHVVD